MHGLAMRGFLPMQFSNARFGLLLSPTGVGRRLAFDGPTLIIIAGGIVRPALAIQMPLQAADRLMIAHDLFGKLLEIRVGFSHHSDSRGANVQPQRLAPEGVFKLTGLRIEFLHRDAFTDQLGKPTDAPFNGPSYQSPVFDALGQPIGDDRIAIGVLTHWKNQAAPVQRPVTPPEAGGIRFPFEAADLMEPPLPLKPDFFGAPQGDFVRRVKGATGQGLPDHRIDMIANPRRMDRRRVLRQGIFGEADDLSGRRKRGRPFVALTARNLMRFTISSRLL